MPFTLSNVLGSCKGEWQSETRERCGLEEGSSASTVILLEGRGRRLPEEGSAALESGQEKREAESHRRERAEPQWRMQDSLSPSGDLIRGG